MVCTRVMTIIFSIFLFINCLAGQARSEKSDSPEKSQAQTKVPSTPTSSLIERKGQQDLEALKNRPKDYRVLILGVQIFLGRFGYGTGPYTGELDDRTKAALKKYQGNIGLPQTGDVDYRTLTRLTEDNQTLDQPIPYLPPSSFHADQWDKALHVQGTWAKEGEPSFDAIQTSKIVCFREQKQCIESTALLLNAKAPFLDVQTHIYAIKEWDDEKLVSAPYEGEPCAKNILRVNRKHKAVTRFTAYQQDEGRCAKIKTLDVQYRLVSGQDVFVTLKQKKAEATQKILRVKK